MNITQLYLTEKELNIIKNIKINKIINKIDYKNKICIKPWGYEYLAFESTKIGIWILNINKNNKTSLHTHFNKDTTLIVISGTIKLNLIDNNYKLLSIFDIINIPKNKFHGIESISDNSIILELEIYNDNINFSDKNDLFRINDIYNRENTGYESSIKISEELVKYDYKYFENNYNDNIFKLYSNLNNINISNDSIYILLKGIINYNSIYIKEGSIINLSIINKIKDNYNEPLEILEINIPYYKEDRKIIYNIEHLKLLYEEIKQDKNILTSGCFDIIHIGHLEILKKSKYLGDNLLVCLSNDKQIKILKGEKRPINNYNDRIQLFKTISYVDYIILYDEENIEKESTLNQIMEIIKPLYWTKGNDYKIEDIIKKHPTINIKLIDNIPNISTTNIINYIINK
jgi:D-beta-D-heptose 7-phosphate kinase/D-beta-D-heptose 1-phosphate adenosyltransferase